MTPAANTPAGKAEMGSAAPELTADFARGLPGGKWDDSAYEAVEAALDKADAPCQADGRWLTLPERVAALAASLPTPPKAEAAHG